MSRFPPVLLALCLAGCPSHEIVTRRAPPTDRSEERDLKPGPDFFWMQGHWVYNPSADDYSWSPGHWEKERTNRIWIPGFWAPRGDLWVWHEETWEERGR